MRTLSGNVGIEGVHIDDLELYSKIQLRLSTVIEVIEEKGDGKTCEQLGAGVRKTDRAVCDDGHRTVRPR